MPALPPPENLAVALLGPNLARHPDKTAYLCEEEVVSYQQLSDAAGRFATLLKQQGIGAGERVMLVLPDRPLYVAAFLGTILAGNRAVPVSTALTEDDYAYILADSGAQLLLTVATVPAAAGCPLPDGVHRLHANGPVCDWLADLPAAPLSVPQPSADEPAFIQYTSGSTGRPKGVPHRHRDMLVAAEQYAGQVLEIRPDDLLFSASKLFFGYGLGNSLGFPLYHGATAILHPGKPTPDELLQLIRQHRPTVFFSVPTIYAQIIRSCSDEQLQLPMRLCVSAGESLPAAIFEAWQQLTGLELLDGIGTTELFHIFISNYPGQARAGLSGRPVPGYEIRLVDDAGAPVPSGTPGHLQVRGKSSTPGYWNLPDKTAALILADGFLRTGDMCTEQDGWYCHQGRSDDMLKAGGQWIAPQQIEDKLRTHPAVADCAVAGYRYGGLERPAAHLVLKPDVMVDPAFERELRRFLVDRLPDYMQPVRWFFVSDLPRTATGKVQRFKLRQ